MPSTKGHTLRVALGSILVVEDEQFTRTMLGASLQSLGFEIAGLCATAACAIETQTSTRIDVALLDLDLGPGPSGIDVAYALRETSPALGVVFLTSYSDPRIKDPSERILPRGARFLVKSKLEDPETLRLTLLDARHSPLRTAPHHVARHQLTPNQITVLRLVAFGSTNAEIARELEVTEKAVERTLQRISEHLGLDDVPGNRRVHLARAYGDLSGKALPSQ
jgi:two-component system, NarL family, invasion response regulator UvrY